MKRLLLAAAILLLAGDARAQVVPQGNGGYPIGAVPVVADFAGNVGTTPVALSIPAAVGKFSYICGVSALNNGATAAAPNAVLTITGLAGGSTYTFSFPFAAVGTITLFSGLIGAPVSFNPCLPGNAINTAVTVNVAVEAGNTATDVNIWGYQR